MFKNKYRIKRSLGICGVDFCVQVKYWFFPFVWFYIVNSLTGTYERAVENMDIVKNSVIYGD